MCSVVCHPGWIVSTRPGGSGSLGFGSETATGLVSETRSGFFFRRERKAPVLHSSLQYRACARRPSGMGFWHCSQTRTGSAYHAALVCFGLVDEVNRNSLKWRHVVSAGLEVEPLVRLDSGRPRYSAARSRFLATPGGRCRPLL